MVHGVSGPMTAWDHTAPFLNQQGFQTLRYDLFGRGFSERVNRKYDLNLYVEQLKELITRFSMGRKVILVGSSFACVVAAEYATRWSDNVVGILLNS